MIAKKKKLPTTTNVKEPLYATTAQRSLATQQNAYQRSAKMMSAGGKAGAKKRGRPSKVATGTSASSPALSMVAGTGGVPKAKKARKKPVSKAPGTTRVVTVGLAHRETASFPSLYFFCSTEM